MIFKAHLPDDTASLQADIKTSRTDNLLRELSISHAEMSGGNTLDEHACRNHPVCGAILELISLPKAGGRQHRIGLDRDSLVEV